jgi:hypothetical protein
VPRGHVSFEWNAGDVDSATWTLIDAGLLDADDLQREVAVALYPTTPEGETQPWPPANADDRAMVLWERLAIRINFALAEWAEQQVNEPELPTPQANDTAIGHGAHAPLPIPGPVDVRTWENPDNYPQPGTFHQVYFQGEHNSGHTLKHIAQKAIAQAVMLLTDDAELAQAMSDDPEIWGAYRALIDCSPWNHALFAVRHGSGPSGYDSPTGEQVSLAPLHDDVRAALAAGRSPRRAITGPSTHKGGGHFAYPWLPPVDGGALLEGVVRIPSKLWDSGDIRLMPPPEVLALVPFVPLTRWWGCEPNEVQWPAEARP